MIHRVRRHVDVEGDILDIASWIARDSRDAAFHFLQEVEKSITSLRSMPGRGSRKQLRDRRLAGIMGWSVSGFPKHLILYRVVGSDVDVLADVHGARRYRRLLRDRTR